MDLFRIRIEKGKLVVRNLVNDCDTPGMEEVTVAVEDSKVVLEGVFQLSQDMRQVSGHLEDDEVGTLAAVQRGAEQLRSEVGQEAVDAMCDGAMEARPATAEDLMACPVDPARVLEEATAWEETQRRWEAAKAEYEAKKDKHDLDEIRKRDPQKAADIEAMRAAVSKAYAEEWQRCAAQQGEQIALPLEKPLPKPLRQGSRVEVYSFDGVFIGHGWYSGSTKEGPLFKLDTGKIVESWKYKWKELPR